MPCSDDERSEESKHAKENLIARQGGSTGNENGEAHEEEGTNENHGGALHEHSVWRKEVDGDAVRRHGVVFFGLVVRTQIIAPIAPAAFSAFPFCIWLPIALPRREPKKPGWFCWAPPII